MQGTQSAPTLDALKESASKACALLKVIANEDRLLVLCQLSQGECNVGALEQATAITQPTLSQQLSVLREVGLVKTRREGKYIYYSLDSIAVMEIMKTLAQQFCPV
jgi:DNA-binding transcriptional ArsR family regulator